MGRSGWLAIGAVIAAVAAGQIAPNHVGAAVALALAAILLVREARPRLGVGSLVRSCWAPGSSSSGWRSSRPDRRRWIGHRAARVRGRSSSSRRVRRVTASRPRRCGRPRASSRRSGSRRPCLATRSWSRRSRPRAMAGSALAPTRRTGPTSRRIGAVGTLTSRTLRIEPATDDLGRRLEDLRRGAAGRSPESSPNPRPGSRPASSSGCATASIATLPRRSRRPA